ELQRQAARRMLKRRALLFPEGGADRDRTMAAALQQAPAALRVGLPAAGPGGLSPEPFHERSSTPPGRALDSHSAWYKTSVRSLWPRLRHDQPPSQGWSLSFPLVQKRPVTSIRSVR